ncbi:MAG: NAD-dependent epimerase/dehydratase family protein [Bacteroidetes bacterium]|nr:NAD-dependent epimerase/dehydratase family protein [Bacteroidota bacterium]
MRVAILGSSGYLGRNYSRAKPPAEVVLVPVDRAKIDYTDKIIFKRFLKQEKIDKIINCAGFTGKPNVDACEQFRDLCYQLNVQLPVMLASVCSDEKKMFFQIGSGCIYQGVPDNNYPDQGFKETDAPNFCFHHPPCSFYSGTKAEMEEKIKDIPGTSIWRLRMPFAGTWDDRNLLVKLVGYEKILEAVNSITHLGEFINNTLKLLASEAPDGVYNCTNSGVVSNTEIVDMLCKRNIRLKKASYFQTEKEASLAMRSPRSACVLDSSKIMKMGFGFRNVFEALEDSLRELAT